MENDAAGASSDENDSGENSPLLISKSTIKSIFPINSTTLQVRRTFRKINVMDEWTNEYFSVFTFKSTFNDLPDEKKSLFVLCFPLKVITNSWYFPLDSDEQVLDSSLYAIDRKVEMVRMANAQQHFFSIYFLNIAMLWCSWSGVVSCILFDIRQVNHRHAAVYVKYINI